MTLSILAEAWNIAGTMSVVEDEQDYMTMNMSWKYSPTLLNMDMDFEVFDNPFESTTSVEYVDEQIEWAQCYESYYEDSSYVCYVEKPVSWDTLSGNFSFNSDTRYSNNNLDILFNVLLWSKQVLRVEMINASQQTFKEIDIKKPNNTTSYEEVFPLNNDF